jgi:3-hydroxyisobutyrate dehydrogenase-like beta-hydroxyacid dehydrogenase
MSNLKIGFVGLGDQGAPIAQAIADSGFELHVWARRAQSFDAISGVNYERHDRLSSVAVVVDILCLCLPDDRDIRRLIRQHRLTESLRPGSTVINHGTGDPAENERIGAFLAESGVNYLDAPVSGGRPSAVARTLTTLVGGDANEFERCREVFETFSRKVAHMGGIGAGQLAKLLNNALTMTNLKNAVDVFGLAKNLGLDIPRLHDVITVSSGSSAILASLGRQIDSTAAVHIQGLMRRDVEHFADAMRALGQDPSSLRDRALSGADGVLELTQSILGKTAHSLVFLAPASKEGRNRYTG